jgi:hypothetical protein
MMKYEERTSDSPHIQYVWKAYTEQAGGYADLAHGFWVLVFRLQRGTTQVILTGPATESLPISYDAKQLNWGIVFRAHVFIRGVSKTSLINSMTTLPTVSDTSFLISGHEVTIPDYETAEKFVDELIRRDILVASDIVARALRGNPPAMTPRTLQRHHVKATGLTQRKLQQIQRARKAFAALQTGKSIADVIAEADYADQSHFIKSLKLLAGQTPGQILTDYQKYGLSPQYNTSLD